MLYHVPDKVKALTEIKRVLKSGGRLVATTVGSGHMDEVNGRLQEISRGGFVRVAVVSFTIENGAEQLKPFFSKVSLSRYEDNLRVTELKPLIAYIRSMVSVSDLQEDKLETLTHEFKTSLEENGEVFVTKASGLFEAVK
jgi:ubiquinone/menaquinone biosynthesis C-methylase UbiE